MTWTDNWTNIYYRKLMLLPPIKNFFITFRLLINVHSPIDSRWPAERSLYNMVAGQVLSGISQQHMVGGALRLLAVECQKRMEQRGSSQYCVLSSRGCVGSSSTLHRRYNILISKIIGYFLRILE